MTVQNSDEKLKRAVEDTLTTSSNELQPLESARKPHVPGPGLPDCPYCRGLGYIAQDVASDDPNFGRLLPCSCRMEEISEAQNRSRRQLSSLGPLATKTFDKFLPQGHATDERQRDSLQRAYAQTRKFAEDPQGWILLHGNYGCGKTHLAAAIANHCLDLGIHVIFVNTPDLLDHSLRSAS